MRRSYLIGILVLTLGLAGYLYVQHRLSAPFMSAEEIAQIEADIAAQDESANKDTTTTTIAPKEGYIGYNNTNSTNDTATNREGRRPHQYIFFIHRCFTVLSQYK